MEGSIKAAIAQFGHDSKDGNNGLHRTNTGIETSDTQNRVRIQLVETFYVTSKKNTVYYVKLTEKDLHFAKRRMFQRKSKRFY